MRPSWNQDPGVEGVPLKMVPGSLFIFLCLLITMKQGAFAIYTVVVMFCFPMAETLETVS